MALNLNGEVETKPGAGKRELAAHYYRAADMKAAGAERMAKLGQFKRSEKLDIEGENMRWKAHGYAILGVVESAASRIGLNVNFKL